MMKNNIPITPNASCMLLSSDRNVLFSVSSLAKGSRTSFTSLIVSVITANIAKNMKLATTKNNAANGKRIITNILSMLFVLKHL